MTKSPYNALTSSLRPAETFALEAIAERALRLHFNEPHDQSIPNLKLKPYNIASSGVSHASIIMPGRFNDDAAVSISLNY